MRHTVHAGIWVGCLVSAALPALAGTREDASASFETGNALLAKADFDGALAAFKTAAMTGSGNQEYAQQYAVLRQVVQLRKACPRVRDANTWLKIAGALRAFYYDHGLYTEALPLDEERHRRLPSAESAVLLGETQLALRMHAVALETLKSLEKEHQSPRSTVLCGLALARMGQLDAAKKLAGQAKGATKETTPAYFYDLGCVKALVGDSKGAYRALTQSFERTPPSRLAALKARVKACKDLNGLAKTAEFARVLETPSKVKESQCSMGTSCGKCPMRAQCQDGSAKGAGHKQ